MPDATVAPLPAVAEKYGGEQTDEPLLKFESGMFGLYGEGITTMTFFEGDAKAGATLLKERLAVVAATNPWICGKVVKEKQHGKLAALRFPKEISAIEIDAIFEVMKEGELALSQEMEYVQLTKLVKASRAYLPSGKKLMKTGKPVCRLTVVPNAADADAGFVVIFSVSHMIANGGAMQSGSNSRQVSPSPAPSAQPRRAFDHPASAGTYTQLLNMLSSDAPVTALSPKRLQAASDQVPAVVGKKHWAHMIGVTNSFNAIGSLMGKTPTSHCFLVDDARLQAAKEAALAKPGAPAKVSANDVLTSGFGNVCKPRLLTMACDFKGRIDGLTFEHAGNYHGGLYFDPEAYADPGGIRHALAGAPPLSRAALPGCWEGLRCKVAIITSWAGFKGLSIPGCTQTMHMPVADISGMVVKAQDAMCIVFNPQPGQTAVLLAVKTTSAAELTAGLPLAAPLSPTMWPAQEK